MPRDAVSRTANVAVTLCTYYSPPSNILHHYIDTSDRTYYTTFRRIYRIYILLHLYIYIGVTIYHVYILPLAVTQKINRRIAPMLQKLAFVFRETSVSMHNGGLSESPPQSPPPQDNSAVIARGVSGGPQLSLQSLGQQYA